MKTVGKLLDTERGKSLMDQYFSRMEKYANGNELPLRIKFKIQDVLDLRRNKWVPRNIQMIDQNPRTLGQIREEATKDYSFLQPGGSIMGNFTSSVNQYSGGNGMPFNVRGSSQYGQQQNIHQLSGQRALDDLYGTNLPPSFGNSNTSGNSSTNSFDKYENSNARYDSNNSNSSNNNSNNYQSNPQHQQQPQQPRRVINQQPSFLTNSGNNSNNSNNSNPRYQANKLNDMSSSSSNSSSQRDDEQHQHQQHNQQNYNKNYSDDQRSNYQQQNNYRQNNQQNNRYNNYNQQQNNYYQNRNNNSGERMNQMNNKMGNLNLRDQNQGNRTANELPPRFQKMQQQQQQNQNPQISNQPPHRNYNNQQHQQDSYNNNPQRNPNHYNNNYNNNQQQPNAYYQRNQQNNYNNNQMNNQQPGNHHLPNQKIINFNAMDTKEISLRPAKNFFSPKPINLGSPGSMNQRNDLNENLSQNQDGPLNRNQLNKPNTPIRQFENTPSNHPLEPLAKEEQKEDYLNKVNEVLGKFIQKEQDQEETIKNVKELKTTKVSKSQLLVHIMKFGLDKSEQERELITKLVTKFKQDDFCTASEYKQAFKQILSEMSDMEADVPKIKSFVAVYIAYGISDEIIDLTEAFDLTVKTVYYPLFLLTLQYLGQNQDQQWLIKKFNDSKLDLMLALPEIDRNKERLSEGKIINDCEKCNLKLIFLFLIFFSH